MKTPEIVAEIAGILFLTVDKRERASFGWEDDLAETGGEVIEVCS